MTKIATNSVAKLSVAFVTVAMLFTLVAPVQAQTTMEDLQAQIAALLAQIAQLEAQMGGGSATCDVPAQPLTIGSQGAGVTALQNFLISAGEVIPAGATGYFGSQTQAALASWQAANGVSPAVGYYGPITKAAMEAGCVTTGGDTTTGGETTSSDLEGGAGSISDVTYVSKLANEEVGEDEEDVEVAGIEVEVDEGSDLEFTAITLNFSKGAVSNSNFDKYASEVSVWIEGEEVARVDADAFNKNNNYDRTISLDKGGIIRADETGEIVVAVSGISNLDTNDATDTWTVEFESVRFRDAQDATVTDSSTGVINDGTGRSFSFENFATAADIELKITRGDDDINDAHVIVVDATNDTDNVELFAFNLEAEGNSDIVIDDMPMLWTAAGTGAPTVVEMANTAELWIDGELVDSLTIPSTATTTSLLTFADFDYTLSAGDKVEAIVKADFNNIDGSTFQNDNTLSVAFGEDQTDNSAFDVTDENGDDLADADMTGSASSDAHVFYTVAPSISVVSTSISPIDNGNSPAKSAKATIELEVTAEGGTLYLNGDDSSTENLRFFVADVYGSGVTASTTASSSIYTIGGTYTVSGSGTSAEYYTLNEGDTMTITVETVVSQAADATDTVILAGVKALQFNFGTANTSEATRSAQSLNYTNLVDDTQSGTASLVN